MRAAALYSKWQGGRARFESLPLRIDDKHFPFLIFQPRHLTPLLITRGDHLRKRLLLGDLERNPGDILFGDDDGLLVATSDELSEAIPIAEEILRKEVQMMKEMAEGVSLLDMLNFEDHYAAVRNGESSKLEFTV